MEIKFNEVDYSYKKINFLEKEVLKNINVEFKKSKINGIIGTSGSGKTTLIELINNLLIPTKGNIKIDNFLLTSNKRIENVNKLRFNVGMVFQFPEEQFFNNTVRDELAITLKFYDYKIDQIEKRISDVMKMVNLPISYLKRNPFTLSNGEKRKLAIASILIINPKVLVLDEPTLGLDEIGKKELIKLLRILKTRYNKTIIIVSHDVDLLHEIVDYIYVLNNKKIVLEGQKYDVFKQVKVLKKYGLEAPKIIQFEDKVLQKKKIKLGYRDDINDLIKDIYRYVK